ncbi:MAG: hypothetical protein ACPGUC_01600 [Gammaproteobacteria bacterium]
MSDQKLSDEAQRILSDHAERRRKFLKTTAKLSIAVPTTALLLAQGTKPAFAQSYGGGGGGGTEVPTSETGGGLGGSSFSPPPF